MRQRQIMLIRERFIKGIGIPPKILSNICQCQVHLIKSDYVKGYSQVLILYLDKKGQAQGMPQQIENKKF